MLNPELFEEKFTKILQWYGKPIVDLAIETYYEALMHLPDSALDPILKAVIGRYEFLPPVEKFLACWEGDPDTKAIDEWDAIDRYVRGNGRRASEIGLSEPGVRALQSIGGLEIFRTDNFLASRSYIRRDFLDAWRSIRRSIEAEDLRRGFLALEGAGDRANDKSLMSGHGAGDKVKMLSPATTVAIDPTPSIEYEYFTDENGRPCARPKN